MRKLFVVALVVINAWIADGEDTNMPKYVFDIPEYPGTQASTGDAFCTGKLMPPFANSLTVYRTTAGKPLNKEDVVAFYLDRLKVKGWTESRFTSPGKIDLELTIQVYENLPDLTGIQVNGTFCLWVASKDGMVTIYTLQHRISHGNQKTHDLLTKTADALTHAATDAGYKTMKVFEDAWIPDYKNEYLIDRWRYSLIPTQSVGKVSIGLKTIEVSLNTYRDSDVARYEQVRREEAGLRDGLRVISVVTNQLLITFDARYEDREVTEQMRRKILSPLQP